jgi:hypothetical protein
LTKPIAIPQWLIDKMTYKMTPNVHKHLIISLGENKMTPNVHKHLTINLGGNKMTPNVHKHLTINLGENDVIFIKKMQQFLHRDSGKW